MLWWVLCNKILYNGFLILKVGFLGQILNIFCYIAFQRPYVTVHLSSCIWKVSRVPTSSAALNIFSHFQFFSSFGGSFLLPTVSTQTSCCIGLLNIPEWVKCASFPTFLAEQLTFKGSDKYRGWETTVHRVAQSWTHWSDLAHIWFIMAEVRGDLVQNKAG